MNLEHELQHKIDRKTKPLGALGRLERLAMQIGLVQRTLTPSLQHPHLIVFAGDHGVARAGVSAYPPEVTHQMVLNFLQGGAAINVFCRQYGLETVIVDAGVNHDFAPHPNLVAHKVGWGTENFCDTSAMSHAQLQACFDHSETLVASLAARGCNVIGFGEMGIGNSSSAAMLMHYFCQLPLAECVGRGTGLDDSQLQHKLEILTKAAEFHGPILDPLRILQTFAGFEIAQMCGAMLSAYRHGMLILIDGFIASSAYLAAQALEPHIKEHVVFCHLSHESGHRQMLEFLEAEPVLQFDMRLGEGVGCALAYPMLQGAVAFLTQMASFDSAKITDKAP